MTPNRRDFLKILLGSAIAESLDVEKLLWIPKPIITVPGLSASDIIAIELKNIMPRLSALFERDDTFYSILENKQGEGITARPLRVPLQITWNKGKKI